MFTSIILTVILLVVLILLFKGLVGRKKPSEQRTSLEKIACSLFSIGRGHIDDAANSLRTAKVMKAEAMQEVNDAILNLKNGYKNNMISLKVAHKQLEEETLPKLKDQPGKLEAKARKAKKDYEKSAENGAPIEAYKNNAKKYIQMKITAAENIKKSEKLLEKLSIAIETAKAEYDGNITELEMIKVELESQVSIPQLELNESLGRIRSLQSELSAKMNQDRIRVEVDNEINSRDSQSSFSSDIDAEFDKL